MTALQFAKRWILIILVFSQLSACAHFKAAYSKGAAQSTYEGLWWSIDPQDTGTEPSGIAALKIAMEFDSTTRSIVSINGNPDYIYVGNYWNIELAYVNLDKIYVLVRGFFDDSSEVQDFISSLARARTDSAGNRPVGLASATTLTVSSTRRPIEARIALIIGNGDYASAPLSDPPNDADLIAETLSNLGFEIMKYKNVKQKEMRRLIKKFGKRLKVVKSTVGVFYYSGHGMQVNGRNYMIPIGAEIQEEDDVRIEAEAIDQVLSRMDAAGNLVNVIILDACRTNRFEKSFKQHSGGLTRMEAPIGTFIAFAAEPHKVALQGTGDYSIFTKALTETLRESRLPIEQLFKVVRRKVIEYTRRKQVPTTESKLTADFSFAN